MKTNKLLKIFLILATISIPSFALRQNEIEPVMHSKIEKVLTVLKKKESNTIRGQEIIRTLDPVFDYALMAKLALAYSKQVLGRVRGKYKLTSAPYELDADQLLQEASEELTEIRTFLAQNNNIFIPKD